MHVNTHIIHTHNSGVHVYEASTSPRELLPHSQHFSFTNSDTIQPQKKVTVISLTHSIQINVKKLSMKKLLILHSLLKPTCFTHIAHFDLDPKFSQKMFCI